MFALPPKQPNETIQGCWLDFKHKFLPGETVVNATVTSSVVGMVAPDSVDWSGTIVTWAPTGGADGDRTVFTVVATGDMGSVREAEVSMKVKAIA